MSNQINRYILDEGLVNVVAFIFVHNAYVLTKPFIDECSQVENSLMEDEAIHKIMINQGVEQATQRCKMFRLVKL